MPYQLGDIPIIYSLNKNEHMVGILGFEPRSKPVLKRTD